MQTPKLGDLIEVTIDSLSYNGGRGVGRYQGVVIFVPLTAPGDLARVRLTIQKPRFFEGELIEVLRPGSSRRVAPCPVFGRCGGCSWQHINYSEQVIQKNQILSDALKKLRKLHEFEQLSPIAADEEFNYRNRIQIQLRDGKAGFFSRGTRDLVEINECLITESRLNQVFSQLDAAQLKDSKRVELAVTEDGSVRLMPGQRDPEVALFSQVNEAQNQKLKATVLEFCNAQPDWVMDLYCGAGNLTFPLKKKFPQAQMRAVELSRSSIERARAYDPGIKWSAADVGVELTRLEVQKGAGLIVVDPPRVGMDKKAIYQLIRHRPKQIVYVSCNPTTFARDAEMLIGGGGFHLEKVVALDMFPQTEHVELVASLRAAR